MPVMTMLRMYMYVRTASQERRLAGVPLICVLYISLGTSELVSSWLKGLVHTNLHTDVATHMYLYS
jgi:hypothetical protein